MKTLNKEYTPGPWKYHLGKGASPRFHIQSEGGYQIASTPELTTSRTAKLVTDFDENLVREANAALIASAPDLLAACKSMLTIAYSRKVSEVQAACAECESAIARAEGRAE